MNKMKVDLSNMYNLPRVAEAAAEFSRAVEVRQTLLAKL